MILINADVRTMTGRDYPNGYIALEGGKIASVGPMEDCPGGGERFDANHAVALPGLIDAHCHIGMWGEGGGFEGDDGNEDSDPCTPHLRAIDAVKLDRAFQEASQAGIAAVVTGPGSSNPIAGQMCALKTVGSRVDDMILKAPLAIKFAFGENPKTTYHEKQQGPVTRMGVSAIMRDQLAKARKYLEQMDRASSDPDEEEPEYDAKCEALLPLMRGQIPAHMHAHTSEDMFTAIRVAKEFGLRCVLVHGTGGHLIGAELAKEGVPVITGPFFGARTKPELSEFQEKTPGVLDQSGVFTAICTDHPEVSIRHLLRSAKLAVEAGMDEQAALRAITVVPARICGLDDRLGTLEPGKDGCVGLYAGDPMHSLCSQPFAVWLYGKRVL